MKTPGERLRWARSRQYRSAAAFARALDAPDMTVRAHENGTRGIDERTARRYAERLGVSWAWLLTGVGSPEDDATVTLPGTLSGKQTRSRNSAVQLFHSPATHTAERLSEGQAAYLVGTPVLPKDIPVYRTLPNANDSTSFLLSDAVTDRVRRPPGLSGTQDTFAIYVVGTAMWPRFDEGDLIYIHPGRPPRPGDDVLIETRDILNGSRVCLIRRLTAKTATAIICQQFQPALTATLDTAGITQIYRIAPQSELVGL